MGCVPKLPVGVPKPFEISCYDSPASFEVALKELSEASDALEQLLESADQFEPLRQVSERKGCGDRESGMDNGNHEAVVNMSVSEIENGF